MRVKKKNISHCDRSRKTGLENRTNYLITFSVPKVSMSYFAKNNIIYLPLKIIVFSDFFFFRCLKNLYFWSTAWPHYLHYLWLSHRIASLKQRLCDTLKYLCEAPYISFIKKFYWFHIFQIFYNILHFLSSLQPTA